MNCDTDNAMADNESGCQISIATPPAPAVPAGNPHSLPAHNGHSHDSPPDRKPSWNKGNKHAGKHFLRSNDFPDDAQKDCAEPARGIRQDVLRALRAKHGVSSNRKLPVAVLAHVGTLYRHEKRCRLAER